MLGFKFHIVTVVGIFVALALGIVIGTSLSDNIIIESQMSTIELMQNRINTLENDKSETLAQLESMADQNALLREHEKVLFETALGKFDDKSNLTAIAFGESLDLMELGMVKNNKVLFQNIILLNHQEIINSEGLKEFLNVQENVLYAFSQKLAEILMSEDTTAMEFLEEIDVVSFNGDYVFSNQDFVFYYQDNQGDEVLRLTNEKMSNLNYSVIAVSNSDVQSNDFDLLETNIDKVGNIDKATGQIDFLQQLEDNYRTVTTD